MNLMKAIKQNERMLKLIVFLCLASMTLLIIAYSPYSPFTTFNYAQGEVDDDVFFTVGTQMKYGMMPYLDTFDHKGPLVYIINWFGIIIHGRRGIWLLEAVVWIVVTVYVYRLSNLFTSKLRSLLVIFAFYAFCISVSPDGMRVANKTEEWVLPFIALSTYYFFDYFKNNNWNFVRVFIIGISFGTALMLKANFVAPWVVFGLAFIITSIRDKKYVQLFKMLFVLFIGIAVIIAPIIIWLFSKGAFEAFVDDYIIFNFFEYSGASQGNFSGTIAMVMTFLGEPLILVFISIQLYLIVAKRDFICILNFAYMFISLFLSSFSGFWFGVLQTIPCSVSFVYVIAVFVNSINFKKLDARLICALYVTLMLLLPCHLDAGRIISTNIKDASEDNLNYRASDIGKTCLYVSKHTTKNDKIFVAGNRCEIYRFTNRLPATKYSYIRPIVRVRPSIATDVISEIKENKPPFIIYEAKDMKTYIDKYDYMKEFDKSIQDMYEVVKDGSNSTYTLYKLKNK